MCLNRPFNFVYLISFFLFPGNAVGQNETIQISFVEASPLWIHTAEDTTFTHTGDNNILTEFSSLLTGPIRKFGDDLLILTVSRSIKSTLPDYYGFVLDKVDFETGELKWKHHNTIYLNGHQDYYTDIYKRKDGDLELVGVERYDTASTGNWNFPGSKSKPIRKTIDFQTGALLGSHHSEEKISESNFPANHFRMYPIVYDSFYLAATAIGENVGQPGDPIYNYGYTMQVLNGGLDVLNTSRQLFELKDLGPFSVDQPPYILSLDENTLVALAYKDRYEGWDNHGTELIWIDISDPGNIHTQQSIDYKEILPASREKFLYQRFRVINNSIFLSHRFPNFEIQANANYILWLNADGSIKTFIDLPVRGEHVYELTDMIYANDNFGYLLAHPSSTDRNGYDILKIRENVDTVEFISSITSAYNDEEFGAFFGSVFEDHYVFFGGRASKEGQLSKNSIKYYCFRAEDLGMDFTVNSSDNFSSQSKTFTLFPNPAKSNVSVLADVDYDGAVLYNTTGKMVGKFSKGKIDVTDLAAGMYLIHLTHNGRRVSTVQKLVKIQNN